MIKVAFFDIDWTLYDHHSHRWVSSGIEAIKELKRSGVKVFICSARPYDSQKLFGAYDLGIEWDGYIASAGAIAVVGDKTVRKMLMPEPLVRAIVDKMLSLGRTAEVVMPTKRFLIAPPDEYVDSYMANYQYHLPPVVPYVGQETTGLLLFIPQEMDEKVRAVCPDASWFRFHPAGVDLSGEIHVKGEAVKDVLNELGFTKEEAISFGDDTQDISMAEATGLFVCMGNGKEDAKAAASYVTSRVEEDGIEQALLHYNLIKKRK